MLTKRGDSTALNPYGRKACAMAVLRMTGILDMRGVRAREWDGSTKRVAVMLLTAKFLCGGFLHSLLPSFQFVCFCSWSP